MAKKNPVEEATPVLISPEAAEVYDAIETIRERIGEDEQGVARVQRRTKENTLATVGYVPVATFSEEAVMKKWGGGKYYVRFYKGKEYCGHMSFEIESSVRPVEDLRDPMPATPAAAGGFDLSTFLGLMMAQQKQTQDVLIAAIGAMSGAKVATTPAADPLEVGLKIAAMIREAAPQGNGGGAFSAKELGEMFREGLETGRMAGGGGEGGDNVLLAPIANAAGKLLDHALTKEKGGTVPATALPAPPTQAPKPEAPAVQLNLDKAPWLIHLRPFMPEIATWAQRGWDPNAYIPSMCARIPEAILDEIELASRSPSFIDDALAALPSQFMAYRAWLTRALEALREEVKSDEETGSITGGDEDDDGGAG